MYNNIPYAFANPITNNASLFANTSLKSTLFSKINWSSLLSNTQKTLNVVNQAIPLYYQVKPVFSNLKTIGKIGRELTKINTGSVNNTTSFSNEKPIVNNKNNNDIPTPVFFI